MVMAMMGSDGQPVVMTGRGIDGQPTTQRGGAGDDNTAAAAAVAGWQCGSSSSRTGSVVVTKS